MKTQILFRLGLLCGALLLAVGCATNRITDFTPTRLTQNPSGLYTISFAAKLPDNYVKGTEKALLTINGQTYPMVQAPGTGVFSYDFAMPAGVKEVRYYYELTYDFVRSGVRYTAKKNSVQDYGKVFRAELVNTYPIQMLAARGPVGAKIPLVGSGFTAGDGVVVGGVEARTQFFSANSIEFYVPALAPGQVYNVVLRTPSGELNVGGFRVDPSVMTVAPGAIDLASGQSTTLVFTSSAPAPAGGQVLEVTTDVPQSIIMAEVVMPEGATTVEATVTGGAPGSGKLFVTGAGFGEVELPVTVR